MKTIWLSTLIFFLFLSPGRGDKKVNHLMEMKLLGPVKFLSEKGFSADKIYGQVVKTKYGGMEVWNFNESGNITELKSYKSDGEPFYNWIFTYDDKGNNKDQTQFRCRVIETPEVDFSNDEEEEELEYNCKEIIFSQYKMSFNAKNQKIKTEHFDPRDTLVKTLIHFYNDSELCSEIREILPNKGLYRKWTYKYDQSGNPIEVVTSWTGGSSLNKKVINLYDDKNQVIEVLTYNDKGVQKVHESRKYDQSGNLLESISMDLLKVKETKTEYQYEYDKFGNWTTRFTFHNDKPVSFIDREILYFE